MKKSLLLLMMTGLMACSAQESGFISDGGAHSQGVIYGEDSVQNLSDDEVQTSNKYNSNFKSNVLASAALIADTQINKISRNEIGFNDKTVEERHGTCSEFKMSEHVAAAFCSGLLIASDLVLTAGHCVAADGQSDGEAQSCDGMSLVFGYDQSFNEQAGKTLSQDAVYHCQKVIARDHYDHGSEVDFAILKLDRPVIGINPVKVSEETLTKLKMAIGDQVYTIGYPLGSTKKIARGKVRGFLSDIKNPQTTLDIFFGNSGGPVFNQKTNELVGVVSRGEEDFVETKNSCYMPKKCKENECVGEAITPIHKIFADSKLKSLLGGGKL